MDVVQLTLGSVVLPATHPRAGADYPLLGYLLMHEDGPIIIDTGASPGHPGLDAVFTIEPVDLPAVLFGAGVTPADVVMVINTHLHFDHIGGNRHFPGVPIVAQHLDFAAAKLPGFTVPEWVEFDGAMLRPVEGIVEVAPGVTVMPTPSHTAGHQSVLVRSKAATELIAGQALHDCQEVTTGISAEGLPPAVESFESVAARIREMRPDRVWFSHDTRPWTP